MGDVMSGNCDSAVDQPYQEPCGQSCGESTVTCMNNVWVAGVCIEAPGACVPNTTRRIPCGTNMGVCMAGERVDRCSAQCMWEEEMACSGVGGSAETCDLQDNDCDGTTDTANCLMPVYEFIDGPPNYAYTRTNSMGRVARFRVYDQNPDPTVMQGLYAQYNSSTGNTRLYSESTRPPTGFTSEEMLGYCFLQGNPNFAQPLFSSALQLREYTRFVNGTLYHAYAVCPGNNFGACTRDSELLMEGYTRQPPIASCNVFLP